MPRPHGYDVEDLAVLCDVVRLGSFTAAATARHYTQSGVSRRVAALERASGGPLFVRRARGVRLTPAGEALHRHAVAVLARLDVAADEVAAIRSGTGGRVRLGAFATATAELVPAAVRAFRAAHAGVALTVREGLTGDLVAGVRAGTLDAAVVSDYPTGVLAADGVELVPLGDDPLLVALPEAHPLADRPAVALVDLAGERWLAAGGRSGDDTVLDAACRRAGFVPRVEPGVASWTGKLGFVAAGLGVTLVPGLLAGPWLDAVTGARAGVTVAGTGPPGAVGGGPAGVAGIGAGASGGAPGGAGPVRPGVVLRPLADDLPPRHVHVALPGLPAPLPAARALADVLRGVSSGRSAGPSR